MSDNNMKTIKLYGRLKKLFGSEYKLSVRTPVEAVKALCCVVPKFKKEFARWDYKLVKGDIQKGWQLSESELDFSISNDEIHILPVIRLAGGKGIGKIIAGIVLIGLALTGVGVLGLSVGKMALMGGILALGGIAEMHTKTPKYNSINNEPVESRSSFVFNGAENVTRQGNVLPIVYGRMIVGSVVVSSGMSSEQL